MWTKGSRNNRSKCMWRPYTYICKYSTKVKCFEIYGYLKGKSSLIIFDIHANLKYKYGNRQFWYRGYYVDTVGINREIIDEYIRDQIKEDFEYKQLRLKEYIHTFNGWLWLYKTKLFIV